MTRILLAAAFAAAVLLGAQPAFAAGANSDRNLKAYMAQRVMEDTHQLVEPEQITLIDVRRGMFRVSWQADTPNGRYACTADDMMRNPSCTRIETPAPAETTSPPN